LAETQCNGSGPEQNSFVLLVEEAHGDDEEYGDGAGDGVQEVELSNSDPMYFL
jgi:hypothetical protein